MASLNAGNLDCTTGTAKRIYDQVLADARNGFSGQLTTAQTNAIKALCYAEAKGVADEINAAGGVGAGEATIGVWQWSSEDWDDVDSFLLRAPDLVLGNGTPLKGFVSFELMIEAASLIASGTRIGTLPVGFRPSGQGHRCFAVGETVSTTPLDLRIDGAGDVWTFTAIPAMTYFHLTATFRGA